MSMHSLLAELKREQVRVWIDGEKLRYRTSKGPLSEDLRSRIKPYKQDIINYLLEVQSQSASDMQIMPVDRSEALPVSFAEERLWFIDFLHSDSSVFQYFSAYTLSEAFDENVFSKCMQHIVSSHEIFRTRYLHVQNQLVRKIDSPSNYKLKTVIVQADDKSERDVTLVQTLSDEGAEKLDLADEGCFQVRLYKEAGKCVALSFKIHHIAYDDQTLSLLWKEIKDTYGSLSENTLPPDTTYNIQYADFAHWQRSESKSVFESGLCYWEKQLADAPKLIDLPLDKKRPLNPGNVGKNLTRTLNNDQLACIDSVCKESGVTRFMLLLGVFGLLLHRYSRQATVLIGTPVSNRHGVSLQGMMGCFLDTLVLRHDFNGKQTFYELLDVIKEGTLQAFDHQHIPFERVVETLNPDRSSSAHPIFQVMFNYIAKRDNRVRFNLPGCSVKRVQLTNDISADFDIKLTVTEYEQGLNCNFLYDTDLFTEATIQRMVEHFVVLLDSAMESPEKSVSQLNYLTLRERQKLLFDWNKTEAQYPHDISLVDMFVEQVQETPDKTAIIHSDVHVTYRELDTRVNQVACYLQKRGVHENSVIGVYLNRSVEVSIALLAILKVNAVYLPLDASYPMARIERMIDLSNASCVLTRKGLDSQLSQFNVTTINIDEDLKGSGSGERFLPNHESSLDDLAYIVFTSGSTGNPKGVRVPHRQILNRLHWMWSNYPFEADDVSCQKTAISFVDSLWELLGPLLKGSTTVLLDDEVTRDPRLFLQSLSVHQVTRLWVVPTLLQLLVNASKNGGDFPKALRFVVASGESLTWQLAETVKYAWPDTTLYNLYGTSEAWDSTWFEFKSSASGTQLQVNGTGQNVPIGKPIDNTQCYILDKHLNPVPVGIVGELYVGGHGLAAGFIENSSSRETAIVENPWSESEFILATGDDAKYTDNGDVVLLGREDGFVNIRGYRIDPTEIEQLLNKLGEISSAAVVHMPCKADGGKLVAYITKSESSETANLSLNADDVRQYLRLHLPHFMIPGQYRVLSELPLTPSGKVDRLALADGVFVGESLSSARRTASRKHPETELECKICDIWKRVLGTHDFGVEDNFFDVGGHSLLAVSLFEELNGLSDCKLELTSLFEAATVSDQAKLLSNPVLTEAEKSTVIPIVGHGDGIPLFFVPPAAGTGLNYRRLGDGLKADQPVYTFNFAIADKARSDIESISTIASRLIDEMRQVQQQGPYILGGMCFGGVVAWEMARQLLQQNQQVASVLLLDSSLPFIGPAWSMQLAKPPLSAIIKRNWSNLLNHRFSKQSIKRFSYRVKSKFFSRWFDSLHQYRELRYFHNDLLNHYEAVVCDMDVFMVCSRDFAGREHYIDRWKMLIGGQLHLDVLEHATHFEMLVDDKKNMQIIGGKIQTYLDTHVNATR